MNQQIIQIDNLPVSKQSAEAIRQELLRRVQDGEISAVKIQSAIKFYEKVFNGDDKKDNGLNHLIKSNVIDEIEKDPKREEWFGFKVSVGEAGVRYNYDNCNDPELAELLEQEKELKEKIKDRQDFLKALKTGLNIVTKDGEAITVFPPAKISSTSAKFTLK
jgi:hypothetical protein